MRKRKKLGVGVIIIDQDNNFLLHLRDEHTPLMTKQWSLVGGAIEEDEEPIEAVKREVLEETSLSVSNIVEIGSLSFNQDWDSLIFQVKVNTQKENISLGEGNKLQLFSKTETVKLLDSLDYTNPFLDFLKHYII